MIQRKILITALTMTLCLLGLMLYITWSVPKTVITYTRVPTKVSLAPVRLSDAPRFFSGIGEIEAAQQVLVSAEISGKVTQIAFESGQIVTAGTLLVQLNDAPEQAEKLRLIAQLNHAQIQYTRFKILEKQNATTKEQFDKAQANLDMAKAALQQIEAQIAQKAIRAPFSGTIGIRQIHLGQYLNSGTPIASLVDSDKLLVNFAIDEQALPHLKIGQGVIFHLDAYPDSDYHATISAIDPMIGKSRMLALQASVDHPKGQLTSGMFTKVKVMKQNVAQVMSIPETAITYSAYGESVFIVKPYENQLTVTRVAVNVGERWAGVVEIESGLSLEDRVVTTGQLRLQEGMAVEAIEEDRLNTVTLLTNSPPTQHIVSKPTKTGER